jgi:replicative DNA helicase
MQTEEIEQALLGCLLVSDTAYDDVSWLRGEYFYSPVHGRIFDAIKKFREEGKSVTPSILKPYFSNDKDLSEVPNYLHDLCACVVNTFSSTVKGYADYVYGCHLRRGLSDLSLKLKELSENADVDLSPKDMLAHAEKFVYEAAELKDGDCIRTAGDKLADIIEHSKRPEMGIRSGFGRLDAMTRGFKAGELTVIAGRPGMGKTAMGLTVAVNASLSGKKVLFFSLEMAHSQLMQRVLSRFSEQGVHSGEVSDWQAVDSQVERITRLPLDIDDTAGLTVSDISSRTRRHKRRKGVDLIVIDYLGLMQATDRRANKVHQVEEITQGLKRLAKELNIPVILLCQLSRQIEQRDDKRPQLSDLRDSGAIEQDADVVLFVYREEYYLQNSKPDINPKHGRDRQASAMADHEAAMAEAKGKAELIVAKNRQGRGGFVELLFNAKGQVFHE